MLFGVWAAAGTICNSLGAATGADRPQSKSEPGNAQLIEVSYDGVILDRVTSPELGDEFGSDIGTDSAPRGGGCLIGAPGADHSVGRVVVYDFCSIRPREGDMGIAGKPIFSVDGGALSGGPTRRFGEELSNIGHVNQDSAVHWAVGAPGGGAQETAPAVVVLHEGAGDLVERFRLEGDPGSRFGWRLRRYHLEPGNSFFSRMAATAPGQANGALRSAGAVHSLDTQTGEVLWTLLGKKKGRFLGYSLASSANWDWDGDGVQDLLVGAPDRPKKTKKKRKKGKGKVFLVSGADGRVLESIRAPNRTRWFGFSLAVADVDRDGVRDIIVGAPFTDTEGGKAAGSVFVFSGNDLSLIERWDGDAPGQWLGVNVEVAYTHDHEGRLRVFTLVAGSLYESRDRQGGIAFYSPDEDRVLTEVLGESADDRLGWRFIYCNPDVLTCVLGVPKTTDFYLPK